MRAAPVCRPPKLGRARPCVPRAPHKLTTEQWNYSDLSKNRFGRRLSLKFTDFRNPREGAPPTTNSSLKSTEQPCVRAAAKSVCSLRGPQGCASAHPLPVCRLEPLCKYFVHLRHTPFSVTVYRSERRRFSVLVYGSLLAANNFALKLALHHAACRPEHA
jgi:hypothetical protein